VASFSRAVRAIQTGSFAAEIQSVPVRAGKETVVLAEDENPKKFNEDKLRKLRAAFGEKGTVTAGNASSINDGAAAVVVLSGAKIKQLGLNPQAKILGYASFAREPEWFTVAPVGAIEKLLKVLSLKATNVDLFEINEAFSVVPMAAMRELGLPHEKVNVNGGAVALGHPIGASGARILVTLIHALQKRGGKIGIASLCIGGGMGVAMAIELCVKR
jgi:acetyl-CoA C-acetyltransferase